MPAPVKSALDLTPELLELTDIEVMNVRSNASGREIRRGSNAGNTLVI